MSNDYKLWNELKNTNLDSTQLYELVKYNYSKNQHSICVEAGERFIACKDIQLDKLYEIIYFLSISYYYIGNKKKGLHFTDYVYLNIPKYSHIVINNMKYYINKLDGLKLNIPVVIPKIDENKYWNTLNPSIIKYKNYYIINCRMVNYSMDNGLYIIHDKDSIVKTRNILLFLDNNFKFIKQNEMICNLKIIKNYNIQGLEDCRLCLNNNTIYYSCTTFENHQYNLPKISIGTYNIDDIIELPNDKEFYVDSPTAFKGPFENRCEKNWLPFIYNDNIAVIYNYNPYDIYSLNIEDGTMTRIDELSYETNKFSGFRGNAGPIAFKDGYLIIIHEVVSVPYKDRYIRNYIHRFVKLNNNYKIHSVSYPFYFDNIGIEYCTGMIIDGNEAILSVGIEDKEAYLYVVSLNIINNMLHSHIKL